MLIALLLSLPEFLLNPTFYFWIFGFIFTLFAYFHKLYLDKIKLEAEAAKKEREHIETELKDLANVVKTHHELRFSGIVADITFMRDKFEIRFSNTEKDIADIKKCFDKLEVKFDKLDSKLDSNNKELLSEIMKLQKK